MFRPSAHARPFRRLKHTPAACCQNIPRFSEPPIFRRHCSAPPSFSAAEHGRLARTTCLDTSSSANVSGIFPKRDPATTGCAGHRRPFRPEAVAWRSTGVGGISWVALAHVGFFGPIAPLSFRPKPERYEVFGCLVEITKVMDSRRWAVADPAAPRLAGSRFGFFI
jgi:hypothetical protein